MTDGQLTKLIEDVIAPQTGERIAVMVDEPNEGQAFDGPWRERLEMAERWRRVATAIAGVQGYGSLVKYPATGVPNANLPGDVVVEGRERKLVELASEVNILIVMPQFSATAPMMELIRRFDGLRVASMPTVSPAMEDTALRADYVKVQKNCRVLRNILDGAIHADVTFSTKDRLHIDLRNRTPVMDDGYLHQDKPSPRLINLPSGETFIVPNEQKDSESNGVLPLVWKDGIVRLQIERNKVKGVIEGKTAADLEAYLDADPARKNLAELGLGCNFFADPGAQSVLESEKAGPHIALGRSEHLQSGGTVGPSDFRDKPWHQDFVYTSKSPIRVTELFLSTAKESLVDGTGSYKAWLGLEK
jgi:hypothetical protein